MSTKRKTLGRGLVALGAAAVLVFAAGVIGRNVGLQQLQAVVTEETGDRRELQPFDLSAYTLFKAENAITHFTLENGELTGRTITETAVLPENAQLPESFSSETTLAVRPEDREEINRLAVFAGSGSASETHDFLVMRDIYLPDNTSLRLYMTEYQSVETPARCRLTSICGAVWTGNWLKVSRKNILCGGMKALYNGMAVGFSIWGVKICVMSPVSGK